MAESTENIVNDATETSFIQSIITEIIYSPVNVLLCSLIAFLIYKIIKSRSDTGIPNIPAEPELPKLRKDFTVQELKKFDGHQSDGRVLVAVNGHVYDVTKGKKFYGPEEYDDLSDLDTMEMESVREWEMQFKEKYEYVGRLLRAGEQPNSYSDEEDETTGSESTKSSKDEIKNINSSETSEKAKDE